MRRLQINPFSSQVKNTPRGLLERTALFSLFFSKSSLDPRDIAPSVASQRKIRGLNPLTETCAGGLSQWSRVVCLPGSQTGGQGINHTQSTWICRYLLRVPGKEKRLTIKPTVHPT